MKKRNDIKGFQFYLILGVFLAAFVIGLFCCVLFYRSERILFWLSVVWTGFYAFAIWSWLDKDRMERFEAIMLPVVFGLLLLFLIALSFAGLWIYIPKIAAGIKVAESILALIVAEGSMILFAFIIYKHYLREPFEKLAAKVKKGKKKSENRDR